jgi:hypothetical protein
MGDEMEMTMQQAAQPTLHSMHNPPFFVFPFLIIAWQPIPNNQSMRMQKFALIVLTGLPLRN